MPVAPHSNPQTMDIITPAELAPAISASAEAHAASLDRDGCFPAADIQALAAAGILAATLPSECGGAGTDGHDLLILLHRLGRGHLALGRVFEAHVNALRLVMRYGQPAQRALAAREAASGLLFALWVTDAADAPLAMRRQNNAIFLSGKKAFCSAAGHADRAVVTASDEDTRSQMLLVSLNRGERISQHGPALQGMRAATTGGVDFTGCQIAPEALLGVPGDYLRGGRSSPVGAWRSSAVALGGLAALLAAARAQLIARKRDGNPHQRARIGRAKIAHQTGRLWL